MNATVEQNSEFRQLWVELEKVWNSRQNDDQGYPVPEMAKNKTSEFLRITSRIAALARAIAANGEEDRKALTPEDFGKMAGKMDQKTDSKTGFATRDPFFTVKAGLSEDFHKPAPVNLVPGNMPGKMANSIGYSNPDTMEIIRRDGERADIIRAKARADQTAADILSGKRRAK